MQHYSSYLNNQYGNVLPMEEALQLYTDLINSYVKCTVEEKEEFLNDFISKATKYTNIRAQWELWDHDTRMREDKGRTIVHNSFIDSVNILARVIGSDGTDASWREQLGDQRQRIGDFACFVTYMIGISNR